ELIRNIELKPDTLKRVREALADVVNGAGGTGGAARSQIVRVAGKTGTAQVVEMKGGYVKSEQLTYFNRDHAWFVSYAPVDNPQIAIAVLVEHGGPGGDGGAPVGATPLRGWQKKCLRSLSSCKNKAPTSNRCGWTEQVVQIDRRLISHFDWTLFFLSLAFVAIGVTTIYSANYDMAAGHAGPLPMRQLTWLGLGLVAMMTAISFDYHYIDRLAYPFDAAMLRLLPLVRIVGPSGGGWQRWINLGIFRLQPSEPAKLAIVLVMAKYFPPDEPPRGYFLRDLWVPFSLVC